MSYKVGSSFLRESVDPCTDLSLIKLLLGCNRSNFGRCLYGDWSEYVSIIIKDFIEGIFDADLLCKFSVDTLFIGLIGENLLDFRDEIKAKLLSGEWLSVML